MPIYNGVPPCSTVAHQNLTTSTTNISHTRETSPRTSMHLRINAIHHQTGVLCGPGHSDRVARGRAKHINSTNAVHPGCLKRACGTDTTLVQSPEHSPGVWRKAPCRVVPDVRIRPLSAPGAWQDGAGTQWEGTIRMTVRLFGSSPHPSPGAYKR